MGYINTVQRCHRNITLKKGTIWKIPIIPFVLTFLCSFWCNPEMFKSRNEHVCIAKIGCKLIFCQMIWPNVKVTLKVKEGFYLFRLFIILRKIQMTCFMSYKQEYVILHTVIDLTDPIICNMKKCVCCFHSLYYYKKRWCRKYFNKIFWLSSFVHKINSYTYVNRLPRNSGQRNSLSKTWNISHTIPFIKCYFRT